MWLRSSSSNEVTLRVGDGAFMVLVGPSGEGRISAPTTVVA
jgi:ABC-type sugar transport system ATPase subunit